MDSSQSDLLEGTVVILPGQALYAKIDAETLRNFTDTLFAKFAKCSDADFKKGYGHRWEGGHDLLIDVPSTFAEHGPIRGLNHAAHILLTDLPTKAGIPIPGLSGSSSLGQWLVEAGIPKGYLSIHWADGALGILAISEGSSDILSAIHGTLTMSAATFYDTFAEGGAEIALVLAAQSAFGLAAFNPAFVIAGGIENILAGVISVYQTASVYVDPLVFFGSTGTSTIIGFCLAYGAAGQSLGDASINAARGGVVGALFSLSAAFGYGALAGFISYKLGVALAQAHNKPLQAVLQINDKAYELLLEELCKGNMHLASFIDNAEADIVLLDGATTLWVRNNLLDTNVRTLSDQCIHLNREAKTLAESTVRLRSNAQTLPDDSPVLTDLYRAILAR